MFGRTPKVQKMKRIVSFPEKSVQKYPKSAESETLECPFPEEISKTPAGSVQNGRYECRRIVLFTAKMQHSVYY